MSYPNVLKTPAWLQTLLWSVAPETFFRYVTARVVEPFTIRLIGGRTFVLVGAPASVKEIFTKIHDVGNDELLPFVGEHSLLMLQGKRHHEHRQAIAPHLRGEALNAYIEVFMRGAQESLRSLSVGTKVNIGEFSREFALRTIVDCVVGTRSSQRLDVQSTLARVLKLLNGPTFYFPFLQKDFGPYSPGRTLIRSLRRFETAIREHLQEASPRGCPIFAHDRGTDAQSGLSNSEWLDETKTLLAAGTEPPAAALAWAMYWMHSNPRVLSRLQQEVGHLSPDRTDPREILENDYLEAVYLETLRMIPPIPAVDRLLMQDTDFLGHRLKAGTRLVACTYLTHRREDIYEEPQEFRPERFIAKKYSPYEFYPFGGGSRRCIGAPIAGLQLKIFLWTLVSCVQFAKFEPPKRTIVEQRGQTLGPDSGLGLVVKEVRR